MARPTAGALGRLPIDFADLCVACGASRRGSQVSRRRLPQRPGEASPNATLGRQLDDELEDTSGGLAAPDIAEAVEEPDGLTVLPKDHHAEPAHTFPPSPMGQSREQHTPQAAPLPVIDDGNGHVGDLRVVVRANVTRDAYRLPAQSVDSDDRLVVAVVDVKKVVELSRRQLLLTGEEPPVARLFAQPLETGRFKRLVLGSDGRRVTRAPSRKVTVRRQEEVDIACSTIFVRTHVAAGRGDACARTAVAKDLQASEKALSEME